MKNIQINTVKVYLYRVEHSFFISMLQVPHVEYPTQFSLQSTSSMVRAGLAASIASMWRGWTK